MSAAVRNKKQFAGSLIAFLVMSAVMLGIYFNLEGKFKPLHYDDPPYLSAMGRRGSTVLVAREAADVEKPLAALAAGEEVDFGELFRSGRFFPARSGTGVVVLERGANISKVRIRKDGREGYVYTREIIAE